MGITSFEFIFFMIFILLAYYVLPARLRPYVILIANIVFYLSFGIKYVAIILIVSAVTFISGIIMSRIDATNKKKAVCVVSIILLVMILLTFKVLCIVDISIVIPLGLSFYSLQAISYIVDVYKGKIEKETQYLSLLTYLSFFPTITSGPIYRYVDFIKCHKRIYSLKADYDRITNGIVYIIYGYFLKLVIAERAATPVEKVFESFETASYDSLLLILIAILYSIRIYMDFAGYSAIVIGIAQIMGFDISENFIAPYLSKDTKDFWNRWHVSFSSWLKDYIYIPLGGNRKGKLRKDINTLITFLVSGLWHGISSHFVIWGLMHGIYRCVGDRTKNIKVRSRVITYFMVTFAWIFFRLDTKQAIDYIVKMMTNGLSIERFVTNLPELGLLMSGWALLVMTTIFVLMCDVFLYFKNIRFDALLNKFPFFIKDIAIVGLLLAILILGIYGDQHDASYFIYRNF